MTCFDVGGCKYGPAYKTYEDAKNKQQRLTEIDTIEKYWDEKDTLAFYLNINWHSYLTSAN